MHEKHFSLQKMMKNRKLGRVTILLLVVTVDFETLDVVRAVLM